MGFIAERHEYKGIYSNRCWIDGQLQEATILFEKGRSLKYQRKDSA